MLSLPVSYHDLELVDPDYYKSLTLLLEYPLDTLGMDHLTFSVEGSVWGRAETVDLVEGGREVPVTDENKAEYVRLLAHHRMTASLRVQTEAMLTGFRELVPLEAVALFDALELELLISGLPEIDLEDLRANTEYHGYKATDAVVDRMWRVLHTLSKEEKALFIQFVTGTSKVRRDEPNKHRE
jgi:E3 ubiquitin-protein ligase HUWE1